MSTPSLLIVPARLKAGTLFSQIPTSGAGDFTVTRATVATRVNASGYIESVASGIPRLDYFASGGVVGCPALLVEPAATNTLSGSVNFSTGWQESNVNTASGIISPSGSANAVLYETTTTAGRVRQTQTLASGSTYTFSCFGKFGALSSGFSLNVFDENVTSYGSGVCQAFNLNEGTLGSSGTVGAGFTLQSVGMENYGSGWYRCRMTVLMGYTPAVPRVGFRVGTGLSQGRPLSVVSGTVNVWGAQLETGSVATSYIPTTTAAITRNADTITVSGAVSGSIGQTSGTVYVECQSEFANNDVLVIHTAGGSPGDNFVSITKTPTNFFRATIYAGGVSGTFIILEESVATTSFAKIALGYASGNTALYINGSFIASGSTGYTFSGALNRIQIGLNMVTGQNPTRIRAAALYTERLTNDELMLLTMPGNNTYLPQAIWDYYLDSRAGNTEVPTCLYQRHADLIDV